MKKILLALTMLTFPLTVQAQPEHPLKAPQKVIQATINRFAKPFCEGGVKAEAEAIYDCYFKTSDNSPDMEICVLGDYALSVSVNNYRKKAAAMGDPEPYADIPYVNKEVAMQRINNIEKLPYFNFLHDGKRNAYTYFSDAIDQVAMGITTKCREMNP